MHATLDRFEGDDAVLLVRPEETERILIPRSLIPEAAEGDIVAICAIVIKDETTAARERAAATIDRLRHRE